MVLLEPWTVYGDAVQTGTDDYTKAVDVPDIGVLPPPGRYLGTVATSGQRPVFARFAVPARREGAKGDPCRRISVDIGEHRLPAVSPVTIVFVGIEHHQTLLPYESQAHPCQQPVGGPNDQMCHPAALENSLDADIELENRSQASAAMTNECRAVAETFHVNGRQVLRAVSHIPTTDLCSESISDR